MQSLRKLWAAAHFPHGAQQMMYDKLGALLSDALRKGRLPTAAEQEHALPSFLHPHLAALDLPINASFEQVKKSYREKMKILHPDVHGPDSCERKTELTAVMDAYEALERHFAKA